MQESTITSKGQTTVPQAIRDAVGATAGARLVWHLTPDGTVVVRVKNRSIRDLAGLLKQPGQRRVPVSDMDPWR
ncbi:MAG: AbrB family transcriptional regulator [Burkholderiales bacterium]|nr:MAG: AbrB family transcriptional regulator [Burkholderiales bacterium]